MAKALFDWVKIQASLNAAMTQVRQEIIKQIVDYPNLNPNITHFMLKLNQHSVHSYYLNAFINKGFHQLKVGRKFKQLKHLKDWLQNIDEHTVGFEPQESPHIGCLIVSYDDRQVITNIQYKEN